MPNIHNRKILNERRNSTPEELFLWQHVRGKKLGYKFYRQHSIGQYIVDFYCPSKNLVVEIDGIHHNKTQEYDKERTHFLESLNNKVLRFWNHEITANIEAVLEKIRHFHQTLV